MPKLSELVALRLLTVVFGIHIGFGASAQFKNIKLADVADGISKPVGVSIAINHKDSKNLVAGIGLNREFTTLNGGKTWTEYQLDSAFGAGGDPVLISDAKGNFNYFHLADPSGKGNAGEGWLDRIVCHTSIDGGITWNKGVSFGNNPPKVQMHPRAAAHFEQSAMYLTWTQFDQYRSKDSTCQSNVMFSKSSHGRRWSDPVRINRIPGDCMDDDNTPNGAMAVVNAEGRLFAAWSNQENIFFDRSYDDGDTWLTNDLVIAKQPGGSSMDIPGIGKCNGMPTLAVDNSESFFRSSLYVVYADQSNGQNDTDIWLIRSTNRGDLWSKPLRINKDEPGKHQFMPALSIDQKTGIVYIVYYDRRAYNDLQTDVYLAYSLDATNHFTEIKISDSSFVPSVDRSVGDYIGVTAYKGIIAPIWTRMDGGHASVWTALIRQEELFKKEAMPKLQNLRFSRPAPRY